MILRTTNLWKLPYRYRAPTFTNPRLKLPDTCQGLQGILDRMKKLIREESSSQNLARDKVYCLAFVGFLGFRGLGLT